MNLENILDGDFSDQLESIIRYERTGYNIHNIHVMRQSACLVVNPVTVTTSLFNCMPAGHASDEMKAPS